MVCSEYNLALVILRSEDVVIIDARELRILDISILSGVIPLNGQRAKGLNPPSVALMSGLSPLIVYFAKSGLSPLM